MAVTIPEKPTEEELRSRLLRHLEARPNNPLVSAVWHGYLASLLEWGVLDVGVHGRLVDLLPNPGSTEMVEIMLTPEFVDTHPEFQGSSQPTEASNTEHRPLIE